MKIISYNKLPELDSLLKEFKTNDVYFIVPSRSDKEWFLQRVKEQEYGFTLRQSFHLWNWDDLYDDLCSYLEVKRLRQIDPPDHRLILSHLVRETLNEKPELTKAWPGLERSGFIDILSDDIRELLNEAVQPDQMESGLKDGITAEVLPRLYCGYISYLLANGLLDSAQIPTAASALLTEEGRAWAENKTFALTGFMSFTHGQIELIRSLNRLCDNVLIFKPESGLKNFQDASRQFDMETMLWEDERPGSKGRIITFSSAESSLEPESIVRELALWSSGHGYMGQVLNEPFPGFDSIAMMVPHTETDSMQRALRRYKIPHRLALGKSIEMTMPGKMLSNGWAIWSQGFRTYETALFLTRPCFSDAEFSVDDALKAGITGLDQWKLYLNGGKKLTRTRSKNLRSALKGLLSAERLFEAIEAGMTPSELMEAFLLFLSEKGLWLDALIKLPINYPELDESLRETASAIEAVRKKALALKELMPDLGIVGKSVLKGSEAVDFLKSWCQETRIKPEPSVSGAVTIHTAPPPLSSWPVWIMTDITLHNWPGKISESPLLNAGERERLAEVSAWLPTKHDKKTQKEALFRRLLQTGDHITIVSKGELDEKGRHVPETPFLTPFLKDMADWSIVKAPVSRLSIMLPDNEKVFQEIETPEHIRKLRFQPVARFQRKPTGSPSRPGSADFELSVSDVETLLDCPMRYWLKRKVRLEERSLEIFSEADCGRLLHKYWEMVWGQYYGSGKSFSAIADIEWDNLASAEPPYDDEFGYLINDRRYAHRLNTIKNQLKRLAMLQEDILSKLELNGFRSKDVLMENTALLEGNINGLLVRGRCDRIEIFENKNDGRTYAVITDYKSGASTGYEKGLKNRPWFSEERPMFRAGLQLSLYALLYSLQNSGHLLAGVCILGHRDGGISGTFDEASGISSCFVESKTTNRRTIPPTLKERQEEAEDALTFCSNLFKKDEFPPFYSSDSCRYCDMKGICRKGEIMGESLTSEEDDGDEYEE